MKRGSTKESFIEKAKSVHGDKFDYRNVDYKNCGTKVEIICPKHGSFLQRPDHHCSGHACRSCANENIGNLLRSSFEDFTSKAKEIHRNKYLYHEDSFRSMKSKIKITCPTHGNFFQEASAHASGKGCELCAFLATSKRQKLDNDTLLKRLHAVNERKYEFDISNYNTLHSAIEIFCLEHKICFKARIGNFLNGRVGCPCCKTRSQGERRLAKILKENKIEFEHEKTFSDLLSKAGQKLRFDFYLPEKNVLIEYDGIQHFEPVERFGGKTEFIKVQDRDDRKNKFCQENEIKLIRIRYDEDISTVLIDNGIVFK